MIGNRTAVPMFRQIGLVCQERAMAEHKGAATKTTTDHETIRKWAEERGGHPAAVRSTHRGRDVGILRLIFPDAPNADDDNLEEIAWDEFFKKFDEAGL